MDISPLIYAHRGMWQTLDQQNSLQSIEATRIFGYGVETDFRSKNHSLVISHNPLGDLSLLTVDKIDFSNIPVALNIKEDGLLNQYESFLKEYPNKHSFLFDGSIPEMVKKSIDDDRKNSHFSLSETLGVLYKMNVHCTKTHDTCWNQ